MWIPNAWYQLRFRFRDRGSQPYEYKRVQNWLDSLTSYPLWIATPLLLWHHDLALAIGGVVLFFAIDTGVSRGAYSCAVNHEHKRLMEVENDPVKARQYAKAVVLQRIQTSGK